MEPERVKEIELLKNKLGFRSRSGLIRMALNSLLNECRMVEDLKGENAVVFTVTHRKNRNVDVDRVIHRFEKNITTSIHQHFQNSCFHLLVAKGEAKEINELFRALKTLKGVCSVSSLVI